MTTYTLAFAGPLLIACVPDGADIEAAVIAEGRRSGFEFDPFDLERLDIERGCILTNDPDAPDCVFFKSGPDAGWLVDEHGTTFAYALRRSA